MLAAVKRLKSIKSNIDNSRNPTRQPHVNSIFGVLKKFGFTTASETVTGFVVSL